MSSTSMNAWDNTQKRIEVPEYKIIEADEQEAQTLEQFLNEPRVDIYRELNDETDYASVNADGSVTRVTDCVTINGVRWQLVPGKNSVPRSVYEFLLQCPEQRRLMGAPQPDNFRQLNGGINLRRGA